MLSRRYLPALVIFLILFALLAPVLLTGWQSLQRAEKAESEKNYLLAAESYAHAARFLIWRNDLIERAAITSAMGGDFSSAIDYFQTNAPVTEEGWVWHCASHNQLADFSAAVEVCTAGTQNFDSARLYGLLAFAHRSQKGWAAEQVALQNQTRLDPSDAFAAYRLGLLLMLSRSDQALSELTRASSLNPELDSAFQTLRASLAVSTQQNDSSMELVILGNGFGLVQEWELAHAAFEQAILLDEKNAEAWAWLGEAKQQLGQDGSVELDQALALDRKSVNVRALRGLYWSRLGKYESMLAEYLLAADIEPENPRWQASLGDAYARNGDLVAALEAYQNAVTLAPDLPEYWRLLAFFCADNGIHLDDIGLPAAEQALQLAPTDPASLDAAGYVNLSSGRYATAEKYLLQAIEISPEYFSAHLHLAMTYLAQGDKAAAFNSLTVIRDAPNAGIFVGKAQQLLDEYFR